jgi:hypothetical protein
MYDSRSNFGGSVASQIALSCRSLLAGLPVTKLVFFARDWVGELGVLCIVAISNQGRIDASSAVEQWGFKIVGYRRGSCCLAHTSFEKMLILFGLTP